MDVVRRMTSVSADNIEPWQISLPQPIRTARLQLRPCREGDGKALAEVMTESYDELHSWFHDGMRARSIETSAVWQEVVACRSLAQFKARERMQFLAWDNAGTLVGSVELFQPDWRRRSFRLAYWMRSSLQKSGYGTEAVSGIMRYSFDVLQARRVTVGHAEPNTASARLIAKLGFHEVSKMPLGSEMPDGTFVDGIGYAMTDGSHLPDTDVSWE